MKPNSSLSRRKFLGSAVASTAVAGVIQSLNQASAEEEPAVAPVYDRKIKIGLIGCGGRGSWLAGLFEQHGGYSVHAVADYFPELAEKTGEKLKVDKSRRFSGLSGYQKVIECGVEAVIIVNIPRFHAEHTRAAIDAGIHVYGAKPVAVDVPGALLIEESGKQASAKKLVYLVDYQMPTDPVNIEVVKRIHEGRLGTLAHVDSMGFSPAWNDPADRSAENLLRRGNWMTTTALSGDGIMEYSIHIVNAVLWAIGKRPVKAVGRCRYVRPEVHGELREVYLATYEFDDGLSWTHRCQALSNVQDNIIRAEVYGSKAYAQINYWGKSYLRGPGQTVGKIDSLYDKGAKRNIATFYQNITTGNTDNPSVHRAVDDALTCVLGREASIRQEELTMEALIAENKALEFDPKGLTV